MLVTDPPYGRGCDEVGDPARKMSGRKHRNSQIIGGESTSIRDVALTMWGKRLAVVFGDLMLAPPGGTRQVLIYRKPRLSGMAGTTAGWQRNAEAVYLLGPWLSGWGGRDSVISTREQALSGAHGLARRAGHPHAKPVDVMETLIGACPAGVIADPFAGSGATLVAARNQGRKAIGVEIDERYCETAARRLSQGVLVDLGETHLACGNANALTRVDPKLP